MRMTRAVIRCKDCDGLANALIPWLQSQGIEELPSVLITSNAYSNTDVWWNLFVPGKEDSANLTVTGRWLMELMCDDPVAGRTKETVYEVCEIRCIQEVGKYAEEIVRVLLTAFGGFWTEGVSHSWGLHGQVASDGIWTRFPQLETQPEKKHVLRMSWKELFERLGSVVQITDCDNWQKAVDEFQADARMSEATDAFKGIQ